MSSGCLLMAQGVLRRTGACSARVLAQASRSLQATSMGLQAGDLQQGPAAFHSGHTGGFAGDAVPIVVGPRGARSAGPSAASRGLCTSSTSAETKEVDQEAATTMIDGEEPNIKYDKVQNENVKKIANQILQLSLIEVAELTEVLKEKLGINDEVMMQQLGAHYGGPVVAAAPGQEEEAKEEKTAFDVKLESFDAAKKLKVIKEVRAITGLGLKEAKELVEKAPSEVKLGVSKEEAEEIQKKLEEVGGTIKVE